MRRLAVPLVIACLLTTAGPALAADPVDPAGDRLVDRPTTGESDSAGVEAAQQLHATFERGDVFVSVGNGQVQWRLPDGTLNEVLDTGEGGFTTGMAFDDRGHLFVTGFSTHKIYEFDSDGSPLGTFATLDGVTDCQPESIVFDAAGNMYVGQAGCSDDVLKFAPDGTRLARFNVAVDDRGSDWIDLLPDQCTLRYTSEGQRVLQYDVCDDVQLGDWASDLTTSYALRVLPDDPFNPDLLVATTENIRRMHLGLSLTGYDAPGENCWFALNLDPDATSFWSADFCSSNVYRFDIASGGSVSSFNTGTGPSTVFGLAVFGELSTGTVKDCSSEDLSGAFGEVEPAAGERTTVRYDARFLVDETRTLFAAEARAIAEMVQDRAERALDRFGAPEGPNPEGLGFSVPAALRIEITCSINFGPIPIDPEPDGFVGEPGVIQLRLDFVQNQLAADAIAGFPANGAWNADGASWKNVLDHEVFHTVQYEYESLVLRFIGGEQTLIESPAMLAQDLFPEVDDLAPGGNVGDEYHEVVTRFAQERPTVAVGSHEEQAKYDAPSVFQYWGERFGPAGQADQEQRVADFMKVLIDATGPQPRAYAAAIGGDFRAALRDYYLAHYGLRAANISAAENSAYAILDAESGPPYEPLAVRGQLDLSSGASDATVQVEPLAGDVYELTNIPDDATHVALRLDTGFSGLLNHGFVSAVVPINPGNEFILDPQLMPAGPNVFRPFEQTIPVIGRDRVAIVFVNGNSVAVDYIVSATTLVGVVDLQFVDPTGAGPHRIQRAAAEPILLQVVPTVDGQPVPDDLARTAFRVQVGSLNASVGTAEYRNGVYHLTAWAPSSLDAGSYPITVTFADTPFSVPGGLVIEEDALPPTQILRAASMGNIGQGESELADVTVTAGAQAASFGITWSGSDFDLTVTSPSGRVIGEGSTDPDVRVVETATSVSIEVSDPEAGTWQLEATGVDVPAPEPVVYEVTETGAPLYGELFVTGPGDAGLPLDVRFIWSEPDGGLAAGTVIASVMDPGGTVRRWPLWDDGGHDDVGAADGVYGAKVWATDLAGTYEITVTADGTTAAGATVQRQASATENLGPKVDTDGDGVADAAEQLFGLDPNNSSDGTTDHDGDGLGLAEELALGSDPATWDTDLGGENDESEAAGGSDPRDSADDGQVPDVLVGATPNDGRLVTVNARTSDGSGTIQLYRLAGETRVDLGVHPGTGAEISDGPLDPGSYSYLAIAIASDGARSGPFVTSVVEARDDVTRPDFRVHLNGGRWEVTDPNVSVTFTDLTEAVADMRLATSEALLQQAPWVPFSGFTTITVPGQPGQHFVYAQLRDAAGNESAVRASFVFVVDDAPPTSTERVSVSTAEVQADLASGDPSLSGDGRFVAFVTDATNLVPGDTNAADDVLVRDRVAGTTERVSIDSMANQANAASSSPSISANGRYVAFVSAATNLVSSDTNGYNDVFVHDRETGVTGRVSVSSAGVQGNGHAYGPAISGDGRFVAFVTPASSLVPGDTNGEWDVFVHDRVSGTTKRVSVASDGKQANSDSNLASISDDGRYVAFVSVASNLVRQDSNHSDDVFVHDRQSGTTSRVSLASDGRQGNGSSSFPEISANGLAVTFESQASNLHPGDTDTLPDVFVRDLAAATTSWISVSQTGTPSGGTVIPVPSISADGQLVAWQSNATNLVPNDTNGKMDAFVRDRTTGLTNIVSVGLAGVQSDGDSFITELSGDGGYVAFSSAATNLVPGDTNAVIDVFVVPIP